MRSSFFRTLLFLPLVLLLLNCSGPGDIQTEQSETVQESVQTEHAPSLQESETIPHLELASQFIGTTELTGNNDGPEVELFLTSVDLSPGNPYCAAFVSYVLDETPEIQLPTIRSGLASHFITDQSIEAKEVLRGIEDVPAGAVVIWQRGNTIFGHAGFVEAQESTNQFITIEANTSPGEFGNQSDGDGVWRRSRSIKPGNYFRITSFTPVVYHS